MKKTLLSNFSDLGFYEIIFIISNNFISMMTFIENATPMKAGNMDTNTWIKIYLLWHLLSLTRNNDNSCSEQLCINCPHKKGRSFIHFKWIKKKKSIQYFQERVYITCTSKLLSKHTPRAFGLLFYLGFKQSVAILHDPTSSISNLERSYKPWDIGHNYCHQTKGVVLLQMGTLSS